VAVLASVAAAAAAPATNAASAPAATAGPAKIEFFANVGALRNPRVKPTQIIFGSGSTAVTANSVTWSTWGGSSALGTGKASNKPVTLTLTKPAQYAGQLLYTCYQLAPKAARAKPLEKGCLPPAPPTAAQVKAAVAAAEKSADLWATVNICNTAKYPDEVGIRGQMPSLGFRTDLSLTVAVEYYSAAQNKFLSTGDSQVVDLGLATHSAHQGGAIFPFQAPAAGDSYVLRGTVTFEWKLGGKVLGQVSRHTGHGYSGVAAGDPPGYSEGTCTIDGTSASPAPSGGTTSTPPPARRDVKQRAR
jgi:hypothetical protein